MSSSVVRHLVVACGWLLCALATPAQDPSQFLSLTLSNGQAVINFTPHSAAQSYHLLSTPDLSQPAVTNGSAALNGFTLTAPMAPNSQFYFLKSVPVSSNAILSALLLNRLAYGPTPDEIDRLTLLGPQAYIDEQTVPGAITEDVNNTHTNLPLIEAKLLAPTALLQILTLSNTVVVITNAPGDYSVTTTATIFTNNGTAISVLSAISTNYSTNVSPAAVTNISTQNGNAANISDLRARHVLRAVGARRQLLEVLLQFLENHFVTQYSKSVAYLNNFYNDGNVREDRYAVQWENQENERWRNALLNPNVTFYDLLKISVESPAMIVYLDTVTSRSDGSRVANENFARELLELFTFGVDNGYDQNDITIMSRSWAGWTIRYVHPDDAFNPFATNSTLRVVNASPTGTTKTNFVGVWALAFDGAFANTTNKFGPIFPGKTIPDRFGPPWAGNSYELQITTNRNTAAERMQKGYDIVNHLANQPFTMEYMCIKLCRLFVHDDFPNPTTHADLPEYEFYNYTRPDLSAEAALVRQCMTAWDTPGPDNRKGNIYSVLRTIFNSELFRTNANMNKIKTPLEFAVSSIRATRMNTNAPAVNQAGFTSRTDGYAISGTGQSAAPTCPLTRMGNMLLFERDSPDGYPETAPPWISAGTLAERLRYVQSINIAPSQTGKSDAGANNITDPVGVIFAKLAGADRQDAGKVADLFIGMIFPGEGPANLNQYRTAAVNFLNTNDSAVSNAFSTLAPGRSNSANSYEVRVRGLVAMLMTFQRFQEQ